MLAASWRWAFSSCAAVRGQYAGGGQRTRRHPIQFSSPYMICVVSDCCVCRDTPGYLHAAHQATTSKHGVVHRVCFNIAVSRRELDRIKHQVVNVLKILADEFLGNSRVALVDNHVTRGASVDLRAHMRHQCKLSLAPANINLQAKLETVFVGGAGGGGCWRGLSYPLGLDVKIVLPHMLKELFGVGTPDKRHKGRTIVDTNV